MDYVTGDIFTKRIPAQTLKAWQPFWDCVDILFIFQNSDVADSNEELPEWRLYWIAGISLLRTIGHVLAKVDAKSSAQHSQAIGGLWKQLQSDRKGSWIFWEFIEKERNNCLKTYSFGARLVQDEGEVCVQYENGDDAFQLFRQAVYWWPPGKNRPGHASTPSTAHPTAPPPTTPAYQFPDRFSVRFCVVKSTWTMPKRLP
jgi:hypothetical protein